MRRRPKKNRWNWGLAAIVWMLFAVTVSGIQLSGCSAYRKPDDLAPQKIKSVVTEVMEDQTAPASKDYTLKSLDQYENNLFNDFGQKSELRAKTMHRLADLYLKLEDLAYRRQLQRYNQLLRQAQQGRTSGRPALPKIDHTRSRKTYEKLLSQYPDRPENDRVFYQLAHVYDDEGQTEQAMGSLQRLVERYPSSPLRQEAIFRLAEGYYDSNQYRQARAAYEQAVNAKDPGLAEQATYKLGWTYLSLQEYENAVGMFVRLVDRKRVMKPNGQLQLDPKGMSAAEWDEVLEYIRGIAFAFSYLGPPTRIQDYFEKAGHRDYEALVYRKLGDLYLAQKRVQDAVGAYEAFIKTYPLHPDAPAVQMQIVEAYQQLKLVDLANRARINFVDRFGEESVWYQKASVDSREKIRPFYRQLTSQMALFYHSEAQQTKRPADYEKALTWYRRYLKAFPKEPDAPRMNFLLAEGLFELQRYNEAADEYEHTAYDYFLHHDSAESGYAAITTLDKIMSREGQSSPTGPMAIRSAQDCKRFGESFPNDPRAGVVLWKGAETYYRAGNLPAARSLAEAIVKTSLPTDKTSIRAQRLIARTYFETGEYEQAAAVFEHLARSGGEAGDDKEIRQLWASSLYKQGEVFKNAGKLREAQTEFMRVQAEVPGSDVAPIALYDAASVALLRNQSDEALQLFQVLMQRYPNHALSQKVPEVLLQTERNLLETGKVQEAQALSEKIKTIQVSSKEDLAYRSDRMLADRYFEQKSYDQAAATYRKLAQEEASARNQERDELKRLWASALYKQAEGLKAAGKLQEAQAGFMKVQTETAGSEVAPIALFDAGNIALSRKDSDGAVQAFTILTREYPSSAYSSHAAIQIARIHEQNGRFQEAALEYSSVVKLTLDRKTAGEMLLSSGRLYEQLGEWAKADEVYGIYLAQYSGEYRQVVETTYKLAWAKLQQGRRQEAMPILQTIIDRYGQGEASASPVAYYVAQAHLLKADDLVIQFDNVRLVSPLEQNLDRKKKLLKEVLDEYAQAADFKVAEVTTAATQKIGTVFEKFRTALLESERPQNLTPQQLEQYNFLLEEQAYPFEEKAIAAYESNVHRAQQLGLYDSWIKQSYDDLARLMPARYRKAELDEVIHKEPAVNP